MGKLRVFYLMMIALFVSHTPTIRRTFTRNEAVGIELLFSCFSSLKIKNWGIEIQIKLGIKVYFLIKRPDL